MPEELTAKSKDAGSSSRPSRKRTTGFPVVPLSEAVQILRKAAKYGFDHSLATFARAMGHSTTNSGAFRLRLSAFRNWGLIAGGRDTVTMTEIARTIAVATDEIDLRQALQQAFWNCEIFSGLYEQMAKSETLDQDDLGAHAVLKLGVAPGKRQTFVKSFVDSLETAQLAKVDGQGNVVLLEQDNSEQDDIGDLADHEPIGQPDQGPHVPYTPQTIDRQPPRDLPPLIRQSWPLPEGEIVFELRSADALPAAAFVTVGKAVEALETLAASLRAADDSDAADEGGET